MYKVKQKLTTLLMACFAVLVSMLLALSLWTPASNVQASAAGTPVATFTFGANGSASHKDGSSNQASYSETSNGYSLSITNGTNMYPSSYDAKGNSCIKLGASSKAGSFKFTVPSDITEVIIYIAKYKTNTAKVTINGTTTTLTKNSNNGEYDAITVNTSSTKTVDLKTISGGYRAMVNTIEFYGAACSHEYQYVPSTSGSHEEVCSKCQEVKSTGSCQVESWSDYSPSTTEEGKHIRTGTCTLCNADIIDTQSCSINADCVREGNQHTTTGTCNICGDSTSVTENCTLVVDSYQVLDTDNQAEQQHAVTTTCSICEQTATANEACSFDEGVVNGTTVTYTCEHCEYSYTEGATLYTVTYVVPNGLTAPEAVQVAEGFAAVLPEAETVDGYTFLGWVTEECAKTETAPTYYGAGSEYTVTEDVTLYALYTYTEGNGGAWAKVTDANKLAVGEEIVIVASGSNDALGTNQASNNRTSVTISKSGNEVILNDSVQIITLEEGLIANTWAFHVTGGTGTNAANGYLYAPANGNYLRTQTSINNNSSWSISINDSGVATIKANVTSGQNWLRKNSNNALFSCYNSGQNDVSIYMKDGAVYYMTNVEVPSSFDGASVTIGEEITLNYYVNIAEGLAEKTTVIFSYNEKTIEAEGVAQADGRYKYSVELAPQYMTVNVNAKLYFNGKLADEIAEYSIATYAYKKLNDANSSEELKRLVSDMLYYGAAAQNYKGSEHPLASEVVENILPASTATPETTNFNIENAEADSYPAYFKGAGVYFDNVNKIYVKLNTTENVTLTVNGEEVAVEDTTVYTDGIKATAFADTYTFVLSYDGEVMQTLTYSVNAYAYAKQNDTEMGTLALALYRYGASAQAYANQNA
ncbi:MAG: hypothetical protein E7371_06045 [Clostridiales bacterium]|nr:hypothetical protein [Clostridiales bacterium]